MPRGRFCIVVGRKIAQRSQDLRDVITAVLTLAEDRRQGSLGDLLKTGVATTAVMAKASRSNRPNHTSSASGGNPTFVMAALVGSSENSVSMTSKTTTRGCVLIRKGFPFHSPSIPASGAVGGMSSDGSWKGMRCSAVAQIG